MHADHDARILPLPASACGAPTLRGIVTSIVAAARRAGPLEPECSVDIDVHDLPLAHDVATRIGPALERLFGDAIARVQAATAPSDAPLIREIAVTSVILADAVEIEIADSGRGDAVDRVDPALAALVDRCGATLRTARCAEGGAAFTLRIAHRLARRLAA